MLLKKLEMVGFKSFADKTEFEFQPGVTAFVGPNGCGKSNVVDAVRWILGEQSAKAVRGTQMLDVIFNGTATRRSLSFAEASLIFLNDRGILPSEHTEVCVTRRLYRNGESEYFLNRQPCRLRDIRQLFMDTGVGVDTYSIIEQGKVERFIQANAKERRIIFEEAAGISRYKAQRREAMSRLERTRLNLQKVEVKLEEQRKQLRSIRYQAAKAKRYREYTARLREIVVLLAVRNYLEWETRRKQLETQIAEIEQLQMQLRSEIASVESGIQAVESEIAGLERRSLEKREELHQAQSRRQAAEAAIVHNEERLREYQGETEQRTREVWVLTAKLRQTQEELATAMRDLESVGDAIRRQTACIAAQSEKADAAGKECERLAASIEEWKNRTIAVIERATTLRNELNHVEGTRRQQFARRSRLLAQQQEKAAEVARLDDEIRKLAGQRDEITGRLADRSALLRERENDLAGLSEEVRQIESQLRDLHHRETQLRSRLDILQDVEMRAEDVEAGVKSLLRAGQGDNGPVKVRGMVADLVRTDLPYAAAIESALGEAAQYLVTTSETEAGAAAALLRSDRSGRAGLIPLQRARAPEMSDVHLAGEDGVVGRASNIVRYDPEIEPVVRHLLGNVWVVKDLSVALRLSNNGGAHACFVTLDGERVEPSGAIIGGEPLPRIGIVSRKSELEAISHELQQLEGSIQGLESARGRKAQQIEALSAELAALRKEIEQGNLEKLTSENEILNIRRRQKALSDESALIAAEVAEIENAVRGYDERTQALSSELQSVMTQHDQLQAEMEAARRNLAEQQASLEKLRAELTRLKVELAEKETQRGGLEHRITSSRALAADLENQIAQARRRLDELRNRQVEADEAIARHRADLAELDRKKAHLEAHLAALQQEQTNAQARRAGLADQLKTLRAKVEENQRTTQQLRLEEQEFRVRIESLSERLFSEQGVRLVEVATQTAPPTDTDWNAIQQEINELREKIRRMGGVNEEAIDEESGLEVSIAQTEAQRDDLLKAEADLQEVIRKLNRVSREKFTKTFEEVRAHFQETFRRLFGGGRCDLVLQQDEPDVLEAGIEVLACPPGKELRSITLLSGGEKTMTTIALLFAIFRAKPSPFCILDEVDAALDENNIDRFTSMLMEFVKDSQFIIITHSKRTMTIANTLYGITMQEKGVSSKVSVKIEDAVKMAG